MSSCALCMKNGLAADANFCPEPSEQRDNLVLEVLKRGFLTVKDTLGWGMDLNNIGWGNQIKDFIK